MGFQEKTNENGEVTRSKEIIVCKGYAKGVNYGEKISSMEKLEGVRTLLAYSSYKNYKVYQMDVQSTF